MAEYNYPELSLGLIVMKWLLQLFGGKKNPASQAPLSLDRITETAPHSLNEQKATPLTPDDVPTQSIHIDPETIVLSRLLAYQNQFQTDATWRHSPSALLKLLQLDSSLAKRRNLAAILGYNGPLDGSEAMNQWLYKAMWEKMRQSPDIIPEIFRD
jgi:hypothetical protein